MLASELATPSSLTHLTQFSENDHQTLSQIYTLHLIKTLIAGNRRIVKVKFMVFIGTCILMVCIFKDKRITYYMDGVFMSTKMEKQK